jgi:hypothetical protein
MPFGSIWSGTMSFVICEELPTDPASPVLLDDLAIQQSSQSPLETCVPDSLWGDEDLQCAKPAPKAFAS